MLKIKIQTRALHTMDRVSAWYRIHMGETAAQSFVQGIRSTIDLLARMPTIGTIDERLSKSGIKFYSFLSHPKYRVVYRFTKQTLYIVAIRITLMEH